MLKPDTLAMTAALALLTALGPLSTDMYLPSLPAIAADLRASMAGGQLTLSAFLIGFAAGQFVYGPVSDRIGRRPVLLFGLGLFVLASLACMLAPTIETLVGARFLQALGASGPIVLGRAIVRDLYEGPRAGRELSRMSSIMGVIPALAPILGGLLHAAFGWRATFAVCILYGVAVAGLVALRLPETIRARSAAPLSFLAILRGFRVLLAHPPYRAYVAFSTLAYGGLFAFISGSSFVLQGIYGLEPLSYGFAFSTVVIGFLSGAISAQRVVSRLGLDGTIGLGVVALALGGAAMLASVAIGFPSSLAVTLPMALYAAGVGLVMPQSMAAALQPFPDRAGAASSLLGLCQMGFAAILGIALGHALGASALPLPLAIAACGAAAFAVFHATQRMRRA